MKLKLKTWTQLQDEGFKLDYPDCYLGSRRAPVAKFRRHYIDTLLGKEIQVVSVEDMQHAFLQCTVNGSRVVLPFWLFEESLDLTKVKKPIAKKFSFSKRPVQYVRGIGFSFPCSFDELSEKDAVLVARWILKSVKGK